MKREEHKTKLQEILNNLTDQGKVTELLAELTSDYEVVSSQLETLQESNTTLSKDAESLRSANMKLFLQIGTKEDKQDENLNNESLNDDASLDNKKLSFNDLFDEKGGLK